MDFELQGASMSGSPLGATIDLTFPHNWQAQILAARPLILPTRHFVYPAQAEEVERGALEVLVHPSSPAHPARPVEVLKEGALQDVERLVPRKVRQGFVSGHDFSRAANDASEEGALAPEGSPFVHAAQNASCVPEFLATCALGFRDAAVPTGLWSTPNPNELCAVSGGYAYIIDTTTPTRFTMIPFRPVLEIRPLPEHGLLLFVGHHAILAWGPNGQLWQSEKLSDEGLTIILIDANQLHGQGWSMITDKETPFIVDLKTGERNTDPVF
jgi:hypothetical protein